MRFGGWAEELGQDLRYSLRVLRRYPGFTAVAVLTLAVGIGANTAIFSVVQALVLGPMAGAGTDRLVSIWAVDGRHAPIPHDFSYPELVDFRARASSFDAVAGRRAAPVGIASGDRTEAGWAELVTTNFFDVLRLEPALGRVFQPEEENDPVAVISHGLWQRQFGGVADIVGQDVGLSGQRFTVIGVTPEDFIGSRWPTPNRHLCAGRHVRRRDSAAGRLRLAQLSWSLARAHRPTG